MPFQKLWLSLAEPKQERGGRHVRLGQTQKNRPVSLNNGCHSMQSACFKAAKPDLCSAAKALLFIGHYPTMLHSAHLADWGIPVSGFGSE